MNWLVTCDDTILYSTEFSGVESSYAIFSPVLSRELNKASTFKFTIYPQHPWYGEIARLKSLIEVYRDGILMFRGRPLDDTFGWNNEREIVCEGDLAYLNDSIQRPFDFPVDEQHTSVADFFAFLINRHNAQVNADRQFSVGDVTVADSNNYIARSDTEYSTTWSLLNDLIKTMGGYIVPRYVGDICYLDYVPDSAYYGTQTIALGINLLDLKTNRKGADIITALIPLGARPDATEQDPEPLRITISGEPDTVAGDIRKTGDYVYSVSAVEKYGWIVGKVIWDDVTIPENLVTKAQAYLAEKILLPSTISITAADLAGAGYNVDAFQLGVYVALEDPVHSELQNLGIEYLVKKLSIKLFNPADNKITVGSTITSFTENNRIRFETERKEVLLGAKAHTDAQVRTVQREVSSEISQTEDEIMASVAERYFTKEDGQTLSNDVATVTQTANGIVSEVHSSYATTASVTNAVNGAKAYSDTNLANYQDTVDSALQDLQAQIDGQIDTYYYDYAPTLNNAPASDWDTEAKKQVHQGDVFVDTSTGRSYRFLKVNNVWQWKIIEDSDVALALQTARDAEALAGTKRRIFVAQPIPPYDIGDLWVQGSNGDILRCQTARAENTSYSASDWVVASKYTDDSALNTFLANTYASDLNAIAYQLDGKAQTYYQEDDPSDDWTTAELMNEHIGDLWYDTLEQKYYRWGNSGWQELTATPPTAVTDAIDSKAQIFVNQPTPPYNVGDLWFNSTTSDIMTCVVARDSGSYTASDWQKRNKYTDDAAVVNMVIGGRNFVLKTATPKSATVGSGSSAVYTGYYYISDYGTGVMEGNFDQDFFVLAFDYVIENASASTGYNYARICPYVNGAQGNLTVLDVEPNETGRYVEVFKLNNGQATYSNTFRLRVRLLRTVENAKLTISNVKLETGNKATEWTAAPEDLEQDINDVATDLEENYSTTTQMNSAIEQSSNAIMLVVNQKVGATEVESIIEQNANSIRLMANAISWYSTYSSMSEDGKLVCQDAEIGGTIRLGGANNINGLMEVFKASNYKIFQLDQNGLNHYSDRWGDREDRLYIHEAYLEGFKKPLNGSWTQIGQIDLSGLYDDNGTVVDALDIQAYSGNVNITSQHRDILLHADQRLNTYSGSHYEVTAANGYIGFYAKGNVLIYADYSSSTRARDVKLYGRRIYANDNPVIKSIPAVNSTSENTAIEVIYYYPRSGSGSAYIPEGIGLGTYNGNYYFIDIDSTSDERLKKNIKQSDVNALDAIERIEYYEFDYLEDSTHRKVGYIAQQLEKIIPEAVYEVPYKMDEKQRPSYATKHINDSELLVYATKAIKEQQKIIDSLESRIKYLEETVAKML